MNLYEMSREFEDELDAFDALLNPDWKKNSAGEFITEDGEIITPEEYEEMLSNRFSALDAMEQDIEIKAENVAVYIKHLLSDAAEIECEERRLFARRKAKENTAKRLKEYLRNCLTAANRKKIDRPRARISLRDNPESVKIFDEEKLIEWAEKNDRDDLLKYSAPEIRKTAVKDELKNSVNIPFTELSRSQSVIIK